ncbi:flagellin [uncultured Clostridium sp.]|uniref:flagellin N-terminal helical domain-containing protein n=1 Tax=uncultured Clostridium sp. TaxID=59620 RepID=UPI0025EA3323|nr:flagellin [uncultured Clostridium sp.]
MRLNHNMNSIGLYKEYKTNIKSNKAAISKISSGLKIQSSKDNPNKIAPSETMKLKIRTLQTVQRNVQDTTSMLQTADGALQQVNNSLSRMKELIVSAGDDTKTSDEKLIIQEELNSLLEGIDGIADQTDFNGIKMIGDESVVDNNFPNYKIGSIGVEVGEIKKIPLFNVSTSNLKDSDGNSLKNIDVTTRDGVDKALKIVDASVNIIGDIRARYGSMQNSLEDWYNGLGSIEETTEYASSKITDCNVAEEMAEIARTQILYQTQISLIAQSNDFPKDALNVLANAR